METNNTNSLLNRRVKQIYYDPQSGEKMLELIHTIKGVRKEIENDVTFATMYKRPRARRLRYNELTFSKADIPLLLGGHSIFDKELYTTNYLLPK